ncbi:hypothetical protein LCGC14_1123460, partial [marine sediment metagenome]
VIYMDALGVSFDDNYLIGDNLHYNNFLGSETFENYNGTYPGDYYGTESFDYRTEDDVYYGTYDFRDELGETETDIDFIYAGSFPVDVEAIVISDIEGHNNVLELDDQSVVDNWDFYDYWGSIGDGTVEFWVYFPDTDMDRNLDIRDGIFDQRLLMKWDNDNKFYYYDGGWQDSGETYVIDTWYHIKIEWECADDWHLWINGISIDGGVGWGFQGTPTSMDRIQISSDNTQIGGMYFDAIGYSWDTTSHGGLGYTVDYNILSQDIEPILEGGYEIDNIHFGDSLEVVNVLDGHNNVVNITGVGDPYIHPTGNLEAPAQWGDFVFTKGAGNTVGELETDNDANYAIIDSEATAGAESLLGTIKPADSDILTNWDDGDAAPHWSKLDEGVGGAPDGNFIKERFTGIHDRWNFDTLALPATHLVTKMIFYGYIKSDWDYGNVILITASEAIGACSWDPDDAYAWKSSTSGALSMNQADLDGFWMDVETTYDNPPGWGDYIETVYVEVYTTPYQYTVDYEITWDVADPYSIDFFEYDYRTTFAIDTDLDIYNWDTTTWLELESNTGVGWYSGSYTLTDPYISGSDEIKIRFQSASTTTNFDMELDQIALDYTDSIISFDTRSLSIYDTFSQGSGTIEFWTYFMDAPYVNKIIFNNDTMIYHDTSYYWRYDTTNVEIVALGIAQWVHFEIIWSGNDVDVYVNGIKELDTFWSDGDTTLIRVDFMSFNDYPIYVDAIGYSWDGSGVYPATYSFEDDTDGGNPAGWTLGETGGTVNVIAEKDNHKKVLELYDDDIVNSVYAKNTWTIQSDGTIEFWWAWHGDDLNAQKDFMMAYFKEDGSAKVFVIFNYYWARPGTIQVQEVGGYVPVVMDLPADIFHHIKLEFDDTANMVEITVNGVSYGDFEYRYDTTVGLTEVSFESRTTSAATPAYHWLDAIGYSWDTDYNIGDNLIQTEYYYFVGDNINSHGKEVITELEDNGWVITNYPFTSIGISGEFNSHKKLLNLTDDITTKKLQLEYTISQTSGTIEVWMKTSDVSKHSELRLLQSGVSKAMIFIDASKWQYWDGGNNDVGLVAVNDQWYHIRFDFDTTTDTLSIYIDGVLYQDEVATVAATVITTIRLSTGTGDSLYNIYFDAISYSWDEPMEFFTGSYNQHSNIEAVIDFVVDIPFEYYERDILRLITESRHFTNILATVSFNLYNFNSSSWVEISNSKSTSETLYSYTETDVITGLNKFVDSSGNVRFRYYGFNNLEFNLKIDLSDTLIYFKTVFTYEKILLLLGTWKYRFKLDEGDPTEYIQDWIYFNVIIQPPNFEGISESEYTTKWVLTSTATTGYTTTMYSDDLTTGGWWLDYPVFWYFQGINPFNHDAYTNQFGSGTNFGSLTSLVAKYSGGGSEWYRFYAGTDTDFELYFDENQTWVDQFDTSIYFRKTSQDTIYPLIYYSATSFDESTITWDNQPGLGTLLANPAIWGYGFTVDLGEGRIKTGWFVVRDSDNPLDPITVRSSEYGSSAPGLLNYYNKFYQNTGSGYAYMQTDTTETLGLKSPIFSDVSLSEGDLFTVDLQTTSDNAQLKLYDGGVLQKTINVLTANVEYDRQEVEVYVDSDVTFDQVKITSELTDTEYLKLYDIEADHWTFSQSEDQRIMYINPFGKGEIIANLGNNSLKIYDNGILQIDTYITITYDLTTYIYQSPLPETVFISFYDSNNDYLDFNKFVVYVDYTIDEVLFEDQRLSSNEFFVDEGSAIYFDVYDSFNASIYQANRLAKTFIYITLNVYELKIKNEKLIPVEYTLKNNDTAITKSGHLFEDEILEYNIASGMYIFEYLKEGESIWEEFTFSFTSNRIFVLNRSKMNFLSYSNQRGEYLEFITIKRILMGHCSMRIYFIEILE